MIDGLCLHQLLLYRNLELVIKLLNISFVVVGDARIQTAAVVLRRNLTVTVVLKKIKQARIWFIIFKISIKYKVKNHCKLCRILADSSSHSVR